MDTVTPFASRRQEPLPPAALISDHEGAKTLAVSVTYVLSEEGRKALLLAGGDGRALQQLTVHVPTNRLHLVRVDLEGVARLKLRPRYELDQDHRVRRIDEVPTYTAPPSVEELFRDASRNYQLQQTYEVEQRAARERRRDAERERRERVAQMFLADQSQRALVHPAPTPTHCYVAGDTGRILFDTRTDVGPARDLPPEAHRRFRADLRARRDRNVQERAAQLALHEEKKRYIAEWIGAHGTPEQQHRQAAGVLPMEEAIEAITDQAFAPLADRPRYMHDGVDRLKAHVRSLPEHWNAVITRGDVVVTSTTLDRMTAPQFEVIQEIRRFMPDATVTLRAHKVAWKSYPHVALSLLFGALVTQRVRPFTLRREYAVPAS